MTESNEVGATGGAGGAATNAPAFPKYECHKTVSAAKIAGIQPDAEALTAEITFEGGFAPVIVAREWIEKKNPEVGGYYVVYEDGYVSYSPAAVFEGGYTLIA